MAIPMKSMRQLETTHAIVGAERMQSKYKCSVQYTLNALEVSSLSF